ncbi:MAG: type IV pilus secretin PilQ [Desulfohalobiaceae bacterium]|nr:type IV pilus secretin PilQ [Desulfohalobiaceae bacterium]
MFGWLIVLLMITNSLCCSPASAPKTDQDTQVQAPKDLRLSQDQTTQAQRKAPAETQAGQPALRLAHSAGKTVVTLPVHARTEINPHYEHPVFTLRFSPAIESCRLPDTGDSPLVQALQPVPAVVSPQQWEALRIRLASRIKFLVSRPRPSQIKLFFEAASQDSMMESTKPSATEPSPEAGRLEKIRFSKDQDGTQLITLNTSLPGQYELLASASTQIKLLMPDIQIPPAYIKLYNLQKFETAVKSALLQNSPQGGILTLKTRTRSPIHIERGPKGLQLRIPETRQTETPPQTVRQSRENVEPSAGSDNKAPALPEQTSTLALAAPSQDPEGQKQYTGQPISINLQDAQVEHILRLIESVAGYSFVLGQGVSGRMSLSLHNVPWDQALDLVLKELNLKKDVQQGNILRIMTYAKYNQEQEQEIKEEQQRSQKIRAQREKQESKLESAPLVTRYIQVNYTKASQIQPQLQSFLTERGKLSSDVRTNQLIVHDTAATIQTIQNVVNRLDRPEKQVLIEARLVYVTDQFQRSMGIKWGGGLSYETEYHGNTFKQGLYGTQGAITQTTGPDDAGFAVNLPSTGTATLGIGGFFSKLTGSDLYSLDAQLELGESKGQVRTISSPKVVTLNNVRAEMTQGTKIATQAESESGGTTTEYVDATLKLSVLPQITPDHKIILELEISDDSPAGDDIETRSAQTKLIVDDEETIVIGGVQQFTGQDEQSRVPGAGNIPLLGWLFKNKSIQQDKRELLIFIHPTIL